MSCDRWQEKMDAYLDAELPEAETRELEAHLQGCRLCSSEALTRSELKRSIHLAGKAYTPDAEFRRRVLGSIVPRQTRRGWLWVWAASFVAIAVLLIILGPLLLRQQLQEQHRLVSELTDLHVITLASANRVDVVSSDRHTVKPWFQGKLPFTFNLPELEGSPFELLGGKLTYLDGAPGAELLFTVRKHVLSVFIFKDTPELDRAIVSDRPIRRLSFNIQSWTAGGLRYFVITDASRADADDLRARFASAAQ
ncbi:MAG TPA: zf-HC2 domain-containing protein [Terriglobales bacterium]|nr:zf-HC2 domain-containing protein [Terriglobales bacterium]